MVYCKFTIDSVSLGIFKINKRWAKLLEKAQSRFFDAQNSVHYHA